MTRRWISTQIAIADEQPRCFTNRQRTGAGGEQLENLVAEHYGVQKPIGRIRSAGTRARAEQPDLSSADAERRRFQR